MLLVCRRWLKTRCLGNAKELVVNEVAILFGECDGKFVNFFCSRFGSGFGQRLGPAGGFFEDLIDDLGFFFVRSVIAGIVLADLFVDMSEDLEAAVWFDPLATSLIAKLV